MVSPRRDDGDCFQAALYTAEVLWDQGRHALIAHGQPRLLGQGERYWHAWVESKREPGDWLVLDFSNGKRVAIPRPTYYEAGAIVRADVLRFDEAGARQAMLDRGHYGPWSDAWDAEDEREMEGRFPLQEAPEWTI